MSSRHLRDDGIVTEPGGLPIHTSRLAMRPMRPDDAATFAAYRSDPIVARYQTWALPFTLDDADRFIAAMTDLTWPVYGEWYQVAIDLEGEMIGDVGVNRSADGTEAGIGYTLAAERHGRGYATEAAAAIVDLLFSEGVRRVSASVDPANVTSVRVLERIGFRHEGTDIASFAVRGALVDDARYAIRNWSP